MVYYERKCYYKSEVGFKVVVIMAAQYYYYILPGTYFEPGEL